MKIKTTQLIKYLQQLKLKNIETNNISNLIYKIQLKERGLDIDSIEKADLSNLSLNVYLHLNTVSIKDENIINQFYEPGIYFTNLSVDEITVVYNIWKSNRDINTQITEPLVLHKFVKNKLTYIWKIPKNLTPEHKLQIVNEYKKMCIVYPDSNLGKMLEFAPEDIKAMAVLS